MPATDLFCLSLLQELALLHHSVRTATVVSQDTVQLLAIGRDDFFDIFINRNVFDDVPDHIKFIRWNNFAILCSECWSTGSITCA